jgi:hypothetical protein
VVCSSSRLDSAAAFLIISSARIDQGRYQTLIEKLGLRR